MDYYLRRREMRRTTLIDFYIVVWTFETANLHRPHGEPGDNGSTTNSLSHSWDVFYEGAFISRS